MSKKPSAFTRMGRGVKGYTYKILGMRLLQPNTAYIASMCADLLQSMKRQKADKQEFAELVQQLHLNQDDLRQKKRRLLINSLLFLLAGLALFFYGCIMMAGAGILIFMNYMLATAVLFVFAFRMHFYRFLIIRGRLDLTYRDWWSALLSGEI